MPGLAERGYHCVALSLRGHGASEGRIRGSSIRDYVDDVRSVVDAMEAPPVLVGHSMGGFVTQHYLAAGNPARAAILVSTVPRQGAWGATLKAATRHPWRFLKTNLTLDVGAVVETPEAARDLLVGERVPDELFDACFSRLERASYRVYLDLLFNRPALGEVNIPALLIGGTDDSFFTQNEWEATARHLHAPLVVLDGASHQPMWEEDGRDLVETIDDFVASLT